MTHRHVVVGVDGSVVSVRALDWAADEAARRGVALHVVYAVPDRDEAGPVLASAAARVRARRPRLPLLTVAAEGDAVRALAGASRAAALTVVGTRGLGGIAGRLLGSVSLRLAAHAHGPLVVVRGDRPCDRPGDVLLGLADDADDAGTDAAGFAFQEAERRGARLRVLHAAAHRHGMPEPPAPVPASAPGRGRAARRERAAKAVPRPGPAGPRERRLRPVDGEAGARTAPARALLEATREAAVVVVAAQRRDGRFRPHPHSLAHTLLHRSHCPVAVIPAR
ncbi:universal stress protein [Streptomyces sp. NPDC096152]|uniref:universal stress protein n=1 Tax=Streptomyces sp. NPDC096152 TaxID=3366078 RepID=UPI00380E971A